MNPIDPNAAGPASGGQPLQQESYAGQSQPKRRGWAAQPLDSSGCPPGAERAEWLEGDGLGGIGDAGEAGSPTPATADITLKVRPFLRGRDFHSTHHENGAFRFDADQKGEGVTFRSYDGVPAVMAHSNGRYGHEPAWYRNF